MIEDRHVCLCALTLDERLVLAARSRRVLDHLYGFQLSPELWRTVRPGLSAGRVQSPALHMVVKREKERMAFVVSEYHGIDMVVAGDPAVTAALRSIDGAEVAASRHFDAAGTLKSDRKSTRLNSSHSQQSRMPSSA